MMNRRGKTMAEKKTAARKISATSTKQEMLEAYTELARQLEEQRAAEMKPEAIIEEKAVKTTIETTDALSTEGITRDVSTLKAEMGRLLSGLSERLEDEVKKYQAVKGAVAAKETELQEIYEIQKSASTLTALLELQATKKEEFEQEMAERKENLLGEIETTRAEWDAERKRHAEESKARDAADAKRREQEEAEYRYAFGREQQLARERFEDERTKLERDIQNKREQAEKEFAEREQSIARSEVELKELREKAAAFPQELETTVSREVTAAVEKVRLEADTRLELLKKEYEGERNVFLARIAALEGKVKEQTEQLTKMNAQLEKAYGQVQQIAVKAVEGSAAVKSLGGGQSFGGDAGRGQG